MNVSTVINSIFRQNWETVTVWKKRNGQYIQDKKHHNIEYSYTLDVKTGDLYKGGDLRDDSPFVIAGKCVCLLAINPVYTSVYMTWHFTKAAVHLVGISVDTVKKMKQAGGQKSVGTFFKGFFWNLPKTVSSDLYNVVRGPIFGVGVELASAYGVVNPYNGRKWEARIEGKWHRNISWKEDWRMMRTPESEGVVKAQVKDIKLAKVCYLAFCFQVKDNIANPRFTVLSRRPIR
ncbi:MAG TPA: hypothetical protein VLG49_04465 [Rhabdochlamydiaceae bacterium]|nr:hypothetical protein [Rhabdochlamydiaceae bacterium]